MNDTENIIKSMEHVTPELIATLNEKIGSVQETIPDPSFILGALWHCMDGILTETMAWWQQNQDKTDFDAFMVGFPTAALKMVDIMRQHDQMRRQSEIGGKIVQ